jgi:hypothetical protein
MGVTEHVAAPRESTATLVQPVIGVVLSEKLTVPVVGVPAEDEAWALSRRAWV